MAILFFLGSSPFCAYILIGIVKSKSKKPSLICYRMPRTPEAAIGSEDSNLGTLQSGDLLFLINNSSRHVGIFLIPCLYM